MLVAVVLTHNAKMAIGESSAINALHNLKRDNSLGNRVRMSAQSALGYPSLFLSCVAIFSLSGSIFSLSCCKHPSKMNMKISINKLTPLCRSILRNPTRNKPHTVLLRIFTNYLQAVIIVKDFNLEWPTQVLNVFDSASFIMSSEEMNLSIECFNYLINGS